MRGGQRVLLIAIASAALAYLLQMLLPWWSLCIAAFVACIFFARNGGQAVLGSLLGAFVLWVIMASVIDIHNDSVLSDRVADIFFVQRPLLLILVTGLVGGLAATGPGLCGFYLRALLLRSKP